ncbi:MAG: metal-dependent hydrolase [Balneolaceae bacterium]
MDPVAHTLFGATLAEAGLKNKTALAAGTLIIGANLPDVDAIAMFVGGDYSLLVRRGWTHGVLALMLWPFLLTGAMLLFDRVRRRRRSKSADHADHPENGLRRIPPSPPVRTGWLLGISFLAVWSHPFLDWLNTYGIRLLMPFDGTWFYGDTLFIIDPWVWLLTGAAVVLARSGSLPGIAGWFVLGAAATALITGTAMVPLTARILWCAGVAAILVSRWRGWFRGRSRRLAAICLAALLGYVTLMLAGSRMTVREAGKEFSSRGIEIRRIMASPRPARLFTRDGLAESDDYYYRFRVNWLKSDRFEQMGEPIPVEEPDEIVQMALESPEIRGFRNWMRFPAYEVQPLEDGWRVIIRDLRYAGPEQTEDSGIGVAVIEVAEND